MSNSDELKELIEMFKQLPKSYQRSILDVVRDRKDLYELQKPLAMKNDTPMSGLESIVAEWKRAGGII